MRTNDLTFIKICAKIQVQIRDMGVLEMKGYILDYINENEYKKLERALTKYNILAFKE